MAYIVENNGVYGLTKARSSPPPTRLEVQEGLINSDSPVDLVAIALQLGPASWRGVFSGDKTQLVPLIAAREFSITRARHSSTSSARASPSTTHAGSTKAVSIMCASTMTREPARRHHRPRPDHGGL